MNNKIKVKCMHFWSDWTEIGDVEIDLEEYVFFEVDYRGKNSWHIIGHKCDEDYNWSTEELSKHQVSRINDLAEFIAQANSYGKYKACKVSRFNNLHYSKGFYSELARLFEMVAEKEKKLVGE